MFSTTVALISNVVLTCITGYYAWLTRALLQHAETESKKRKQNNLRALASELTDIQKGLPTAGKDIEPFLLPLEAWQTYKAESGEFEEKTQQGLFRFYHQIRVLNSIVQYRNNLDNGGLRHNAQRDWCGRASALLKEAETLAEAVGRLGSSR